MAATIIRVNSMSELGRTLSVISNFYLLSVLQLSVTAEFPSLLILSTLMMEATHFSETSVLTRATRRHIPEDGNLHSHSHENLKSYIALTGYAL
jgi:hypothetical protein